MKRPWLILLAVLLILAIAIIVSIIVVKQREKRFNHFEFPNTMIARNYTDYKRADTIAMVVLNKMFNYDTVILNIYKMPYKMSTEEYEIAGFIQKNPYEPYTYNIFVQNKTLPVSIKTFLCHELIHLHQMEIGYLIPIDNTKIVYQGDTIYFSEVPYDKRLYEMDASWREYRMLRKLNSLLYSK